MGQKIRKAIFPVAGLGTRFLPVTKANPKEMLPVVDKPLIQYAVEEAVAAGKDQLPIILIKLMNSKMNYRNIIKPECLNSFRIFCQAM